MRAMWRLGIRNWSANPGRTGALVLSVVLGVAMVVTVTDFHEAALKAISREVVNRWLGSAHVSVHPVGAHWGSLNASLADAIRRIDNILHVTARLRRPARMVSLAEADHLIESAWWSVDAIGITPETERHFKTLPTVNGRELQPGDRGVAVIEWETAKAVALGIDDSFLLSPYGGGPKMQFQIVGLFDSRRMAEFQRPAVYISLADLQELKNEQGKASVIDVMLEDASPEALAQAKSDIEECLTQQGLTYPCRVETAGARQMVLGEAERITRLILVLLAFISLLTSFFIILTTQGVSLVQRRRQLGVMRCLGLTRGQLALLLSAELVPLGVIGTLLGVLLGMGITRAVAFGMSDVLIHMESSPWGIALAASSGVIATGLSTLLLIHQVTRVTPLAAVNTQAVPVRMANVYLAGVLGVGLLALHQWMATSADETRWLNPVFAAVGTGSLYIGYVLITPAVVVVLGRPIARVVGRLLALRPQLAEEPFVRAPWRTSGACWVLMVGLSLIVYVATRAEGVMAIWDFPARLPETFVWSREYVSGDVIERVKQLPGVGSTTVVTDVPCEIETASSDGRPQNRSIIKSFLSRLTKPVFVAGDPEKLLGMVKVAFTEGLREQAMAKLQRGGFVLIPSQTAKTRNLHLGDRFTVSVKGQSGEFEVAGVIESPALDLAVTAFQAQSYMQFAAASAILGTRADLKEKFGLDVVSMFMCDLDLPPAQVPPDFDTARLPNYSDERAVASAALAWREFLPNEQETIERIERAVTAVGEAASATALPPEVQSDLRRFAKVIRRIEWMSEAKKRSREESWMDFRERLVLLKIADAMDRPGAIVGSLRRLTSLLDRSLRHAMIALTWLPSLILGIAAIGIANLMMISVHLRSSSIAVLRAVGAQKSQILRLVLAEAVSIAVLGSVMGLALGLHEAYSVNRITAGILSVTLEFIVPLGTIGLAVLLTIVVCVLAGLMPARYAARNNIIEAMQAN